MQGGEMWKRVLFALRWISDAWGHLGTSQDLLTALGIWKYLTPVVAGGMALMTSLTANIPWPLIIIFVLAAGCIALFMATFLVLFARALRATAPSVSSSSVIRTPNRIVNRHHQLPAALYEKDIVSTRDLYLSEIKASSASGSAILVDRHYDMVCDDQSIYGFDYKVHKDFGSNSQFLIFYMPSSVHSADALEMISKNIKQFLSAEGVVIKSIGILPGQTQTDENMVFTGKIYIYHEDNYSPTRIERLTSMFLQNGSRPEFRGPEYASHIK